MELASGYSDSINYGNGYTPLATGAINNNNANYAANQEYARLMGQYDPFAQSGGFGTLTNIYSNAGAAYGRATGGFGEQPQAQPAQSPDAIAEYYRLMSGGYGQPGGYTPQQPAYDDSAGLNPSSAPNGGAQPYGGQLPWFWQGVRDWTGMGAAQPTPQPQAQPNYSGWGIGSDAGQSPGQYQNPAVDWTSVFNTYTQPALSRAPQVEPNNPGSNSQTPGGWGQETMNNPNMQRLLGYTPAYGAGGGLDPNNAGNIAEYYRLMGGGGPKDQSQVPTGNRNPVQGGPDIGPFWQGIRDYFGADPKDQSRVPQTGVQAGGGLGQPGFGPYGGSSYTGQPGYGLAIGQIGAPGESLFGADPGWTGNQGSGGMLPGYGGLNDTRDAVTRELIRQQQMWQPSS
jgi:hypothetical protein